jgi:DNA-binding CsgD family transcriptional regulator
MFDTLINDHLNQPPARHEPAATVVIGPNRDLLTQVLEQLDHGILLLAKGRRLLYANRVAQRECARHPALRVAQGCLTGRRPGDTDQIDGALRAGERGLRTLLTFDNEPEALPLVVMPVLAVPLGVFSASASSGQPKDPCFFLAMLAKRSGSESINIDLYARANGLTPSERDVLKGLSSGFAPSTLAQQLGVSIHTMRTHISHIRQKTGTPHLRGLLALVHNLPAVVCTTGYQN